MSAYMQYTFFYLEKKSDTRKITQAKSTIRKKTDILPYLVFWNILKG